MNPSANRPADRAQHKICYVIDNLSFRGGERNFAQLALGLDRSRYEPHVICSPGGTFVEMLQDARIHVHPVDMRNKWNLSGVAKMAAYLRRRRIALVHTQGRGDPFGRIAARLAGVPVVSTVQMIVSRYWGAGPGRALLYRTIDWTTNRLVHHYIVVNRESAAALEADYGIAPEKITLVQNGIEVDRFMPSAEARQRRRESWRELWGIREEEIVVGAVGKLTWQKGFDLLLGAWQLLMQNLSMQNQRAAARLLIFGEGEEQAALAAQIASLGLGDSCVLAGFEPDIAGALAGMDLFALSSRVEGLPMVLLEAMAAGLPTVATAIPGVVDAVADGADALLVERENPAQLSIALARLIQDRQLAHRLGAQARRTACARFTVERMVRETESVYRNLLDDK
jgi:glycosyltransferase involved in cell wall biosynthesis